jgi:hypothetical protein
MNDMTTKVRCAYSKMQVALMLTLPVLLSACGLNTYIYPGVDPREAAIVKNTFNANRRPGRRFKVRATLISVDGQNASGRGFLSAPLRVYIKPGRHELRVTCSYNRGMRLADDFGRTFELTLKAGFVYRLVAKPMLNRREGCKTVVRVFPRRD